MLIKACLNGSREPGAHPKLPLSPQELAAEGRLAVEEGAGALHIHPRQADGKQSMAPPVCDAAVSALRERCPGVPVGVTTAFWIEPNAQRRIELVRAWRILPDFASVNFSEPGTLELCAALLERGIGVEAGLSTPEDARLLAASGIAEHCLRVLIEPEEEEVRDALTTVEAIVHLLAASDSHLPRLLHGSEKTAWPLLKTALERGYDTRIGLEDVLHLPDGREARDNAELVARASRWSKDVENHKNNSIPSS